jgi:hypothetical protein
MADSGICWEVKSRITVSNNLPTIDLDIAGCFLREFKVKLLPLSIQMKKKQTPDPMPTQTELWAQTSPEPQDDLLTRLAECLSGLPILEDERMQEKQDRFDEQTR